MSRFQFSAKAFLFFGCLVVFLGLLINMDEASGYINRALQLVWLVFLVTGSAILGMRMWMTGKDPDKFRRAMRAGQSAFCQSSGSAGCLGRTISNATTTSAQ
jgi:hypothetical protein